MGYNISIRLDTRRKKNSGLFPVKLRIYEKDSQIEKWYNLDIDLTENDFVDIWVNPKNKSHRSTKNELRLKLQAIENRANQEASKMEIFDLVKFEFKFFRRSSDGNNVKYHFDNAIAKCIKNKKIGTAESFKYTLSSFGKFNKEIKNKAIERLTFKEITVDWLKEYETFMLESGKSITTIAIYTRTLRVIFNNAIEANDLNSEYYPFGKNKYMISRTKKVKKALTSEQLKILFNANVSNENEAVAKAFWFFSYACNGMNLKDIALLKFSNFQSDKFSYYRAKTFDKTTDKKQITIYLTEFTKGIIEDYGLKDKSGYVFDILEIEDDAPLQYKKIKNFTRYINDHIKKLAVANELPKDISSYWARHSFATNSVRKGASLEFISEALNHSDLSVTKGYFDGFEDETKREFANSVMDF